MSPLESANWNEIAALNQRGGRCLSLVDLIEAGTISSDLAAACAWAVWRGSSLLTAARHGGTGKTTLMASLLMFMPPGEAIVTISHPRVVGRIREMPAEPPVWALAHEIGSGQYYGYIWGRTVADYLGLAARGQRVASCLHADTMDELRAALLGPELAVAAGDLGRIGLILFMRAVDGRRRRVTSVWITGPGGHRMVALHNPGSDLLEQTVAPDEIAGGLAAATGSSTGEARTGIAAVRAFLDQARADGLNEIRALRARFLALPPREGLAVWRPPARPNLEER